MNPLARRVERNKEEVRKLSQRGGNRFCIDCGMRGPLYVVSNFHVFVCSTCAALHRSQQHKVKGISMTEFTDAEVASLTVGGNDRAARVWLARYQKQRPRQGNDRAVKDFIVAAFNDLSYVDREELERLQCDVCKAVSGEVPPRLSGTAGLPPSPESSGLRRAAPPPSAPLPVSLLQEPAEAAAGAPLQAHAPSSSLEAREAHAVPTPPVDLFGPSVPLQPAQSAPAHVSSAPTDDDMFADFLTAAAPPPSAVVSALAGSSFTAQAPLADWFAFSAAPAQLPANMGVSPAVTAGPLHYMTPQLYPQNTSSQLGISERFGVQQGGYVFTTPSNVTQLQPQQFQYAASMGPPVAPNVVPYQAPIDQAQAPSVGAAALTNMNSVNFFQEPPADPWKSTDSPEPTKTGPTNDSSASHNDAFAALDPFGSKW
ncbi:ADP-ribosylation factor GTPase activating protein [Trypanosoma rangeli]|uniref:ADP-ribosylation factor GTPase activating protein n=1 Tax=Trypanosoma rangeli TaxID=5698 RepID=A0A3R7RKK5_TRYRA|nr:ADP-ribosylation factor GTPase activating protein [Trypanosoma rangeli]RNF06033.1 ADP-ribosylation factor GTPase activating protein [Trypanosoma rangeli]|eukprot:RNF06033.1 ADP-ribosylation factor GTPase activating protein [Trypanosoma rangeli]